MATVSEKTGKPRLEASQKVRNDHELFLEAYERPTQIYRFLKARHTLEPLFLQRNLSYMKHRRERSKRNRVSLEKLVHTSEEDLSSQIKSDNHLCLSFESLSRGKDFLRQEDRAVRDGTACDRPFKEGTLMDVEVLLYRFKHPTPEALITSNPSSLIPACTSLGRCVVPYYNDGMGVANSIKLPSITIPGSMLSWKGTNGLLGTHMLAFRVSPVNECTKEDSNSIASSRKRKTDAEETVVKSTTSNLLVPPEKHSRVEGPVMNGGSNPNGIVGRPNFKKKPKKNVSSMDQGNIVCNGQADEASIGGRYTAEMLNRLHRKVPGGKKLPTVSERTDKMIVSLSRKLLTKEFGLKQRAFKKRNELQLLLDGDKPKTQWISDNDIPVLLSDGIVSKHGKSASPSKGNVSANPRKRNLDISHPEDTLSEGLDQPPAKKPYNSVSPPCPASNGCSSVPPSAAPREPSDQSEVGVYCAELVAFDSRQECLLVDGEYEILMQRCSRSGQKDGKDGLQHQSSSIEKDSLFGTRNHPFEEYKTLTIKFSAKWLPHPPKPRPKEVAETAADLLRIRKDYEKIIQFSSQKRDEPGSVPSRVAKPPLHPPSPLPSSSPKPTVFNFLYNKDTLQQTELKDNFTCPWCSLDCNQLYSLLKHMSLCHPRFKFTYKPSERGLSSVDVRINKLYDTKQPSTDPVESMGKEALLVRRQPTKLKPTTSLLVERCEECDEDLSEFTSRRQIKTPKLFRTFYHSQSCLPMLPDERDSEEEDCTSWLKITSMKMVDEFIDVNFGEKQFMKVWNSYMMDHKILADKQVPVMCVRFAKDNLAELREKCLTYNLISHLTYMCDIGLVPPATIREVFKIVHQGVLP